MTTTRTIQGRTIYFDADGFMVNSEEWTEGVGCALASEEGLEDLTESHMAVIRFLRDYYSAHKQSPSIRRLTRESGITTRDLYELFPPPPLKRAAKIAGVKKPRGCV